MLFFTPLPPKTLLTPTRMIKDLRIIQNRDPNNMIIVDNCVGGFANHLPNGIPIIPFETDTEDVELLKLQEYLVFLDSMEGSISSNNNRFLNLKKLRYFKDPLEYIKSVRDLYLSN